ncbi:helix-turn-helix domain-containing protein [Aminobacter sp. AP02]|uniref:helix-turn-helix domain-containing protein n=1 Tax=Aminobacter sp. AP02 TaxID=2135737 RepID=UPI000D7A0546|nr:helix-turn-helix domain-containing protein [Aminobacter sp. AP02]PWK68981.1 AraC family transcriptional regulator [Aminobacter sp. AP02]
MDIREQPTEAGVSTFSEFEQHTDRPVGQHLQGFEFSTSELPINDQFAGWRDNFAPMLSFSASQDTASGFDGQQVIWDLGSLAFSKIRTQGLQFTSLPGHVRRDPLDHWMMTLLLDGHSNTVGPTRVLDCDSGLVQVHPLGRPFEGHVSNSEMLMLIVPRDFCRDAVGTMDAAEFSALDTGMGKLFADFMVGLEASLPTLNPEDLPGLVSAMRAMIVACVAPTADHLEAAQDPLGTVLLERARRFVSANLYDPDLGAEMLRRALGISRTRLYRLFEPTGGVMSYIQHRRLLDAHAALANQSDGRKILEIAEERGFSDGADFSRAFKRKFGYSPSDARTRGLGEGGVKPHAEIEAEAPSKRWGKLLRRLQG